MWMQEGYQVCRANLQPPLAPIQVQQVSFCQVAKSTTVLLIVVQAQVVVQCIALALTLIHTTTATRLARGVPTTAITATPPVAVEAVAFPLVPHVVEVTLMTTMMETLSDNIEESTAMIQKILEQVIAPCTPTMMTRSHPQVERVKEVPCRVVAF